MCDAKDSGKAPRINHEKRRTKTQTWKKLIRRIQTSPVNVVIFLMLFCVIPITMAENAKHQPMKHKDDYNHHQGGETKDIPLLSSPSKIPSSKSSTSVSLLLTKLSSMAATVPISQKTSLEITTNAKTQSGHSISGSTNSGGATSRVTPMPSPSMAPSQPIRRKTTTHGQPQTISALIGKLTVSGIGPSGGATPTSPLVSVHVTEGVEKTTRPLQEGGAEKGRPHMVGHTTTSAAGIGDIKGQDGLGRIPRKQESTSVTSGPQPSVKPETQTSVASQGAAYPEKKNPDTGKPTHPAPENPAPAPENPAPPKGVGEPLGSMTSGKGGRPISKESSTQKETPLPQVGKIGTTTTLKSGSSEKSGELTTFDLREKINTGFSKTTVVESTSVPFGSESSSKMAESPSTTSAMSGGVASGVSGHPESSTRPPPTLSVSSDANLLHPSSTLTSVRSPPLSSQEPISAVSQGGQGVTAPTLGTRAATTTSAPTSSGQHPTTGTLKGGVATLGSGVAHSQERGVGTDLTSTTLSNARESQTFPESSGVPVPPSTTTTTTVASSSKPTTTIRIINDNITPAALKSHDDSIVVAPQPIPTTTPVPSTTLSPPGVSTSPVGAAPTPQQRHENGDNVIPAMGGKGQHPGDAGDMAIPATRNNTNTKTTLPLGNHVEIPQIKPTKKVETPVIVVSSNTSVSGNITDALSRVRTNVSMETTDNITMETVTEGARYRRSNSTSETSSGTSPNHSTLTSGSTIPTTTQEGTTSDSEGAVTTSDQTVLPPIRTGGNQSTTSEATFVTETSPMVTNTVPLSTVSITNPVQEITTETAVSSSKTSESFMSTTEAPSELTTMEAATLTTSSVLLPESPDSASTSDSTTESTTTPSTTESTTIESTTTVSTTLTTESVTSESTTQSTTMTHTTEPVTIESTTQTSESTTQSTTPIIVPTLKTETSAPSTTVTTMPASSTILTTTTPLPSTSSPTRSTTMPSTMPSTIPSTIPSTTRSTKPTKPIKPTKRTKSRPTRRTTTPRLVKTTTMPITEATMPYPGNHTKPEPEEGLGTGVMTGIIAASIVGFWIILGPVVCIICRCRDKAKERKERRRHGCNDQIESGLIEEMIFMELARGREKMYNTDLRHEDEIRKLHKAPPAIPVTEL